MKKTNLSEVAPFIKGLGSLNICRHASNTLRRPVKYEVNCVLWYDSGSI